MIATIENPQPHQSSVLLESRLFRFVIARENLDVQTPILDLNNNTLICRELRHLLKTRDDIGKMPSQLSRPCALRFEHRAEDITKRRLYLDANATKHFNEFLRHLIAELSYGHVMNFVRLTNNEATAAYIDFLESHYLDAHDIMDNDFNIIESLKKGDFRLRKLRQTALYHNRRTLRGDFKAARISAAELRAMHDFR